MDTISSLTNLTELQMTFCDITDADTQMFAPLANLSTLVLNYNELTDSSFLNMLPESLDALGLFGNDFTDISNVSRFKNLTILGMGDNYITDFSFINELPALTDEVIRHAEGDPNSRMRETYYYGTEDSPVTIENGTVVIPNPYTGQDGKPISFDGATAISDDFAEAEVTYDENTNEITLTGMKDGTYTVSLDYSLPLLTGDIKYSELRIIVSAEENVSFTVEYDWGTDVPDGITLLTDQNEYDDFDEALNAVDATYTDQTKIAGTKDGKEGTWKFSGWTLPTEAPDNGVIKVTGFWTFEEHQHKWGETEYTWSDDGTTCTAVRVCTENKNHIESETVSAKAEITKEATCTSKGETTYTATFENDWAKQQSIVKENIDMIPHNIGDNWKYNENGHWKECTECGAKAEAAPHTFEWVVDREATASENGLKHEECSVCGYEKEAVAIPKTDETKKPSDQDKSDQKEGTVTSAATGDYNNILIWGYALGISGAAAAGAILFNKKRQK
jgi:hypothetical protein